MPRTLADALASGTIVLDGGLGTLLEAHGHDLASELWSARMLIEDPASIVAAHREYFEAGARVGISSSYQVSFEGLAKAGIDHADTERLLRRSVELVRDARDEAAGGLASGLAGAETWVAASVGPYGAMLADGSEYRGDYGLSVAHLREWHRPRIEVLADAAPDVLAIETIPSLAEAEAIVSAVAGTGVPAWLAVTVAYGALRSGEPLAEAYAMANDVEEIIAVGVNCSDPLDVAAAIATARSVTAKPIVVYPNSGEQWDAKNRRWMGPAGFPEHLVQEWVAAGATLIGGCCRVGPLEIASIADVLRA